MAQAVAYGARVVNIDGNFDDCLRIVRDLADYAEVFALVNSVNPDRLEGQKTAAFEIIDDLGDAPDLLFIPVGNAGNITAYWRGFVEHHARGIATKRPRMMGYQAEGAAPIVRGEPVASPQTIASAIRIGNPANWAGAAAARDESGGAIESVTDDEILEAHELLSRREGIFCEPASAASVRGSRQAGAGGRRPLRRGGRLRHHGQRTEGRRRRGAHGGGRAGGRPPRTCGPSRACWGRD